MWSRSQCKGRYGRQLSFESIIQRIHVLTPFSICQGIPDFRTPGTGLYDNLAKYELPYPQAIFDIDYYKEKPQAFCTLAQELWPGRSHSPTLTHSFLKLLSQRGLLLRNYTQVRELNLLIERCIWTF